MFQFLDRNHILAVYNAYNFMFAPIAWAAYALAWAAFFLTLRRRHFSDRAISLYMGGLWVWLGLVFHLVFAGVLSLAAYAIGALFMWEGFLFFRHGWQTKELVYRYQPVDGYALLGAIFALFSLTVYPYFALRQGWGDLATPASGLSPGAAVTLTFGLLLMTSKPCPRHMAWIPLAASLFGSALALTFDFPEDKVLFAIGILGALLIISRKTPRDRVTLRRAIGRGFFSQDVETKAKL